MILNQFGRRNLINYQRSVLALEIESVYSERAKEKQREAGGAVPQMSAKAPTMLPNTFLDKKVLVNQNFFNQNF